MVNTPKFSSQQLNPNTYQNKGKNKKLRRRLLLALAFMLPLIFSTQYSIYQQQKMIKEKQIILNKEKQRLSSLKKIGHDLEYDIKTLTGSEEGILKFARKLYGFSKPDETIFQITE
ncbi:FtsB family cell division protein [Bacillus gaemokensis]|uniref:Cell division protein DivIVC n=1 Tax=Bacillus gaemokensis TaxID=574375 RepID=A0A073KAH3_9BACI|nr:septum formation initiator family protein [Bacillus gaemokensis]KEK23506.1 cell division protein DivIVC [Bacillus gaemokensis]KYG27125.1 cell division protein DivIVC [Bacillus gaemokensis]